MRAIQKQQEPHALAQYRQQPNANYDGFAQKDDLRVSLVEEQHGVCCYCMGRIRADATSMRIEHWRAKSVCPAEQLVYSNLLGACGGGSGSALAAQHCDVRKGNNSISVNPANARADLGERFVYGSDGSISSKVQALQSDIGTLGLEADYLKTNRKAALDKLLQQFRHARGKRATKLKRMQTWWAVPKGGLLQTYCEVALYYLRKKSNWLQAQAR